MRTDLASAIPGSVTALGVFVAAVQLWISRVQARGEVEQKYIERYWKIDDERSVGSGDLAQDTRYLRLCEDEFEWRRLGQVRTRTWAIWHAGIRATLDAKTMDVDEPDVSAYRLLRLCIADPYGEHMGQNCPAIFEPLSLAERFGLSLMRRAVHQSRASRQVRLARRRSNLRISATAVKR